MRTVLLLILVACSSKAKHGSDLGDVNAIVQKLNGRGCLDSNEPGDRLEGASVQCTKRDRTCGCHLTVGLQGEKGSSRVSQLGLVIGNCAHEDGLKQARALLDGIVAGDVFDDLDHIDGALHKTHGDISVDATWSPDVFQIGATQERQTTESFHVAVRPKDGKPDTQTKLTAPVVTKPPACDPRNEDMASIGAGPAVVTQPRCGEAVTSLPAYTIDKQRVSCDAYTACVAATRCKDAGWKCADTAVASREAATDYCQWRGAMLPSLAQLQRAIRGAKGDKYPTGQGWLVTEGCKNATAKDPRTHEPRRCQNVSADGVVYYVMDTEAFEWTRDVDCEKAAEPASTKPVGMNTFNETLDSAGVRRDPDAAMGTFRCAR